MPEAAQAVKRTRADAYRDRVKLRLPSTGIGIAEVLLANGITLPGVDWQEVSPHWIVALVGDEVIGCAQVMPAKPIGYLNFLLVKPTVPFKLRAIALRKLAMQGLGTLDAAGCSFVAGHISDARYIDVAKRLNFVHVGNEALLVKRLK